MVIAEACALNSLTTRISRRGREASISAPRSVNVTRWFICSAVVDLDQPAKLMTGDTICIDDGYHVID